MTLTPEGETTRLEYSAAGNLTGPLANFGQRLVDSVGKQFISAGAQAMADELAGQSSPAPEPPAMPKASVPAWVYVLVVVSILALVAAGWALLQAH